MPGEALPAVKLLDFFALLAALKFCVFIEFHEHSETFSSILISYVFLTLTAVSKATTTLLPRHSAGLAGMPVWLGRVSVSLPGGFRHMVERPPKRLSFFDGCWPALQLCEPDSLDDGESGKVAVLLAPGHVMEDVARWPQ
ncbi:hypothetical protein ACJO2E_15645 [Marinobacter sp. M1N3S26]|uniref:hypothetical protein n=1 Tax=Marinobacter sp. M1N3S26 TaxID=3382299 RepID=UPI00387AD013